jgi:hypothetical protein
LRAPSTTREPPRATFPAFDPPAAPRLSSRPGAEIVPPQFERQRDQIVELLHERVVESKSTAAPIELLDATGLASQRSRTLRELAGVEGQELQQPRATEDELPAFQRCCRRRGRARRFRGRAFSVKRRTARRPGVPGKASPVSR